MKNEIILFDLDRTIFNTDRMMQIFTEKLMRILDNPSSSDFISAENEYKSKLLYDREFIPEHYVETLCKRFNFSDQMQLVDVFFGSSNQHIYKDSVYEETTELFKILKNKDYRIGVFSEGTKKFQQHKFISLALDEYIDPKLVYIFEAKNNHEALKKIPKDAIVVDDKISICEFLNKNGVRTFWLNKKGHPDSKKIQTIHNLLELAEVLE